LTNNFFKDLVAIITVAVIMSIILGITTHSCVVRGSVDPDVPLWLARSCVGEAGFKSAENGECAAIAWIYRKRQTVNHLPYYEVVRKYSASVKPRSGRTRLWVMSLRRDLSRPKGFPKRLVWARYRDAWADVLDVADRFVRGEIADPLPDADHFGGRMDHWRAERAGWIVLRTDYRNIFYRIRR
jgi:hypothetical protein